MKIIVCIKQVPASSNVEVDEETGVLRRDGVDSKMNPYDLYAIETALYLKEQYGGTVTAITMGPPQAKEIIKEAYMMGVDNGFVLSDRKFAGADVLATSFTLSEGIKVSGDFDIIICGKQTTDGDTAQIGPALAEHLNIPHVAWVSKIEDIKDGKITVLKNMADSEELVKMTMPCLITVEKDIMQPRFPSFKKKLDTYNRPIHILSLKDFSIKDESKYGLSGSATKVERIFPPDVNTDRVIWAGDSDSQVGNIYKKLLELKVVD